MKFLFVGERPSHQAVKIGATWQNGKLAAKQLHDALRALGIEPSDHEYCNLYTQPASCARDAADEQATLKAVRQAQASGLIIVGMGAVVSMRLEIADITHLRLIHPAARGAIRKKERYTEHVSLVLTTAYDTRQHIV